MKRKLIEALKDVLIVLLVLVNLMLAVMCLPKKTLTETKWLASALRPFAGLFGLNEAALTYTAPPAEAAITGAAQPIAITLSTEAGRQSAQYDFSALDTLYSQYGSLLAQALESAAAPEACTRQALLAALAGPGAAFCFPGEVSPAVVGAWLSAGAPEAADAQWYVLALEDGAVTLYLGGAQTKKAATGLDADVLAAQLAGSVPDGSFFAFEAADEAYASLDALSLVTAADTPVYPGLSANPCDARFISALATQIGINPYGDARYVDNDGTTSFTETGLTLRVSAQGRITLQLSQPDERFQSASESASERIEAARRLVTSMTGGSYGDARVYLQGYEQSGDKAVCTFGYYLAGVEVAPQQGGIEVRFSGTQITFASILCRTYSLQTQPAALLPAAQAAAAMPDGSALRLLYAEDAAGELQIGWRTEQKEAAS